MTLGAGRAAAIGSADADLKEGISLFEQHEYRQAMESFSRAFSKEPQDAEIGRWIDRTGGELAREQAGITMSLEDWDRIDKRVREAKAQQKKLWAELTGQLKDIQSVATRPDPKRLLKVCRGLKIFIDLGVADGSEGGKIRRHLAGICNDLEAQIESGQLKLEADIHKVLGYLALCNSRWDEAVNQWREALAIAEDPVLKELVAKVQARLDREQRRKEQETLLAQARSRMDARQWGQAKELWRRALKIDPRNAAARAGLRECREQMDLADAAHLTQSALAAEAGHRWVAAAAAWIGVLEIFPRDVGAAKKLASARESCVALMRADAAGLRDESTLTENAQLSRWAYNAGLRELAANNCANARDHLAVSRFLDPRFEYLESALKRARECQGE